MGELELEVEFEGMSGVSQYANPKVETLKFITQTTNYKDNELSLIAERITHPCPVVKRDLNARNSQFTTLSQKKLIYSREEEEETTLWREGEEDLLHSTKDDLQLTFSGHGLGIISKSDFDH